MKVFPSSLLILLPFLFHTPCFYRVFNMDCNVDGYLLWHCGGNLFSGTHNVSPLFFFSDLCVCRSFFHVFSLLFYSCCAFFYPFLPTEASPLPLRGSALATIGSVRASSEWLCPAQDNSISFLRGATTAAAPAIQTLTLAHSADWKLDRKSLLLTTLRLKLFKSTVNFSSPNVPLL